MKPEQVQAGVRWLRDMADSGRTSVAATPALLRDMAAAIEHSISVQLQLRPVVDEPRHYFHNGTQSEITSPEKSDMQVAGEVRMLTHFDFSAEALLNGKPPLEYYCVLVRDRIVHLSQRLDAVATWHPISTAPAPAGFIDNHPSFCGAQPTMWLRYLHDEGPPLCLVRGRLDLDHQEWIAEEWALIPGMPLPEGAER